MTVWCFKMALGGYSMSVWDWKVVVWPFVMALLPPEAGPWNTKEAVRH